MNKSTGKNKTNKNETESEYVRMAREQLKQAIEQDKRNKAFAKLSPAEQRIEIAKDALTQIKLRRLVPSSGVYVELEEDHDVKADTPVCNIVNEECNVCAKGALFVAAIDMKNGVRLKDVMKDEIYGGFGSINSLDTKHIVKYLKDIFTKKQLDQIEAAFKDWDLSKDNLYSKESLKKVGYSPENIDWFVFMPGKTDDETRLVAILKNIVRNNGEFVLETKEVGHGSAQCY